jgi:hypothetical protein
MTPTRTAFRWATSVWSGCFRRGCSSRALAVFQLFHVQLLFRVIYFATTLAWSFLMFSYLHDIMHVEGFWLEKNRWLKRWFTSARKLHDIHEVINDQGLMDKKFRHRLLYL